jgi:hypothetical protein
MFCAGSASEVGVNNPAFSDGYTSGETRIGVQGVNKTGSSYFVNVWQESIRESAGRSHGDGRWDVLDAVVDHTGFREYRVGESGGSGSLDASTVIDVNVHDHGTLAHLLDGRSVDEVRSAGSHNENRSYNEIRACDSLRNAHPTPRQGREIPQATAFEFPQAIEVAVYYNYFGSKAAGYAGSTRADDTAAKNHDSPRTYASCAA